MAEGPLGVVVTDTVRPRRTQAPDTSTAREHVYEKGEPWEKPPPPVRPGCGAKTRSIAAPQTPRKAAGRTTGQPPREVQRP
jgi:hypothetical protein